MNGDSFALSPRIKTGFPGSVTLSNAAMRCSARLVGTRNAGAVCHFRHDLADRFAKNRVQFTTDGHKAYLSAVEDAFGANIDYAMLLKIYGNT